MSSTISAATANANQAYDTLAGAEKNLLQAGGDPTAVASATTAVSQASVQANVAIDALKIANDASKSILNLLA